MTPEQKAKKFYCLRMIEGAPQVRPISQCEEPGVFALLTPPRWWQGSPFDVREIDEEGPVGAVVGLELPMCPEDALTAAQIADLTGLNLDQVQEHLDGEWLAVKVDGSSPPRWRQMPPF
jgi:hypothetical protein